MLLNGTSGRLVNPGVAPDYGPKGRGMINDSGMAPSLGALAQPMPQGHGGGLMRLMQMYGRPGRSPYMAARFL